MNADFIGYRYTRDELSALLMLLRLSPPPGMAARRLSREDFERVTGDLQAADLLVPIDKSLAVDRLSAFLLTNASACQDWLCVAGPGVTLALWRGASVLIMGKMPEQGSAVLTPLKDLSAAARALEAETLPLPAELSTADGQRQPFDDPQSLSDAIRKALSNMEG